MDLFESLNTGDASEHRPLADRMRPEVLDDLKGQEHLTGPGTLLREAIDKDRVFSILLWGPPGCGKTTLANIIAQETQSNFVKISAVLSGVKEVRQVIEQAKKAQALHRRQTLLFVDEIHRFNKAQQDAFLHHVENGLIVLVGATTENPSFEVIPALVSRCRVFTLKTLTLQSLLSILKQALTDTVKGLGCPETCVSQEAMEYIARAAEGDARVALASLDTVVNHFGRDKEIVLEDVETALEKKLLRYDKSGEEHYNLISAFIKSMRGSDPDAAIYWLARMLGAGDDPYYMLRRMIRFATEDIGLADPGALTMALNAAESFRLLGHPEGDDALFQAAIYLATAPKSNAVYTAHKAVKQTVRQTGHQPVPLHLRNAPTKLMKQMGYAKGYKYAHDFEHGVVRQSHLPDSLVSQRFYTPTQRGYEKVIQDRMAQFQKLTQKDQQRRKP